MRIPSNKTEQDVIRAIEKSVAILGPKYVFGCYDFDDLRQECYIWTIELLEKDKYDETRPLENYIFCHLRNRLINFLRDKLHRNDPPCKICHSGEFCSPGSGEFCHKYNVWKKRNSAKSNIMRPLDITNVADEREKNTRLNSTAEYIVSNTELMVKIDQHLPVELRASFLQMLHGVSVAKGLRDEVCLKLNEIVNGGAYDH